MNIAQAQVDHEASGQSEKTLLTYGGRAMTSESSRPRVLIADDQWNVCEALRLLLKGDGYDLEMASSPEGAVALLHQEPFDLLLLDLNYTRDTTSGREGLDLLTRAREIQPELPLIVMTAWSTLDLAIQAMRRGACDFIQKPWDNREVLSTVRKHVAKARGEKRIQAQEVRDAVHVQRKFLPGTLPQRIGYQVAAEYLPARDLGGDYFGVEERNGKLALCIADVAGKGLPAALLMANLQAALRPRIFSEPDEACTQLNRVLHDDSGSGRFVSMFHAVLDEASKTLTYCNAGHLPAVVVHRNGTIERLAKGGAVLGYFQEWTFEQSSTVLEEGSRLILFTDGVVDATNVAEEEFGEERLMQFIADHHADTAEEMKNAILGAVMEHCGGRSHDDATLLVVAVE